MSGFLNWALEGLQRLRDNGWKFSNGKTVEIVREDYIVRSDPYKAFVMHCIIEDSDSSVKKDVLYSAYKEHCEIHNVVSRTRDSFFKNFKDNFKPGALQDYRPNKEEDPERPRMFKGILLRERGRWCQKAEDEEIPEQHGGQKGGLNGLKSNESKESRVFDPMSPSELKDEILRTIDLEAPKTKYHSMRPKAIFDKIGLKFPDATISDVFKICEQANKEGILIKNGTGAYFINVDGGP